MEGYFNNIILNTYKSYLRYIHTKYESIIVFFLYFLPSFLISIIRVNLYRPSNFTKEMH